MVVNLSAAHSLVSNWIAELRDNNVQNDRMRFRRNLERIGEIAAYEISKELPAVVVETKTPLGIHKSKLLAQQPVLATILRAGLPMHNGLLNYFWHEQSYQLFSIGASFHCAFSCKFECFFSLPLYPDFPLTSLSQFQSAY